MQERIGTARLDRGDAFTASAFETFHLTYTAGRIGVDDTSQS